MFACNLPFLSVKTRARRRKTLILEGNCLKGYFTSKFEFVIIYSPFDKQRTDDGYSSGAKILFKFEFQRRKKVIQVE